MLASGGTGKEDTASHCHSQLLEFPMILGTNSGQTRIHSFDDEKLED